MVFLYHDVSETPSEFNRLFDLNVPPPLFEQQLEIISRYFTVIGPEELLSGRYRTPAALITFDDGNAGYFRVALPILKRQRVPSVAFINAGPIKGDVCWSALVRFLQYRDPRFPQAGLVNGDDDPRLMAAEVERYLAAVDAGPLLERVRRFRGPIAHEEDLTAVSTEPLVYLGNHLYNHYNAAGLTETRLRTEYRMNQAIIDAHPRGTRLFSYPFGQPETSYNEETTRVLHEEGAAAIFSAYSLPNFGRRRPFYHRVTMTEDVRGPAGLFSKILVNYVPARLNVARERLRWCVDMVKR